MRLRLNDDASTNATNRRFALWDSTCVMRVTDAVRRKILEPAPGTALARARDYGIDLTLVLRGVERSPDERMEKVIQAQSMARMIRHVREGLGRE